MFAKQQKSIKPAYTAAFAVFEIIVYVIALINDSWLFIDISPNGICSVGPFSMTCYSLGQTNKLKDISLGLLIPCITLTIISIIKIPGGMIKLSLMFEILLSGLSALCSAVMLILIFVNNDSAIANVKFGGIVYCVMLIAAANCGICISQLTEYIIRLSKTEKVVVNDTEHFELHDEV